MKRVRVMIVDDAIYMRGVLKDILERHDMRVAGEAKDGKESVDMYKRMYEDSQTPDVVLMDITMKRMDGIEAMKRIKKIDNTANVVMISSVKSKPAVVQAIQEGANGFVPKPFKDKEVIQAVHSSIKKNQ